MNDESLLRLSAFFGILVIMSIWQSLAPRRKLSQGYRRWPANLGIVVLNSLIVRLLFPTGAAGVALWAESESFGLMNQVDQPAMVAVIIAVVLLDLAIYLQHLLFHAVPLLWRLHMVHHADIDIDVTTGLRFHPVEIILSMLIKMAVTALLGVPALAVVIFEVVLNGMAMFNHANINLPVWTDRAIRILLVTPDMHRIHHSVIRRETNSNFGFNLSIWDRIFGTYAASPEAGQATMRIGLAQYQDQPTHHLGWMLRLPITGEMGQYPMMRKRIDRER